MVQRSHISALRGAIILSLNASAVYLGISFGAALGGLVLKFVSVGALGEVGGGFVLIGLAVLALSLYPLRAGLVGRLGEG